MDVTSLSVAFLTVTSTFSLPPGLLSAICKVESNHNIKAINHKDGGTASHGVCQIKLGTARDLGFAGTEVDLLVTRTNVYWAGAYLKKQLIRYKNNIPQAVAAYNAGTCRFNADGKIMNRKYVGKVFNTWQNVR